MVACDTPFALSIPPGRFRNKLVLEPGQLGDLRTRIVVTQPEKSRLQHFDRLLLFEDGCIVEMGPPAEVMASELHLKLGTNLFVFVCAIYNTYIYIYIIKHTWSGNIWRALSRSQWTWTSAL